MDNLTHGLAGVLVAQAGFRQRYGRSALIALVLGAELPDCDALFDLAGPITAFQHHRGMTHSFAGGLGLALLGAVILYGVCRYRPYWRLVALVYLGVLLHLWMDYLTSYGTQLFLPFDAGRYTADAVFIIDFLYTGIIVTALVLVRMIHRQRQRRYGLASLGWAVLGVGLWHSASALSPHPLMILAMQGLGLHLAAGATCVAVLAYLSQPWPAVHRVTLGRWGLGALAAYMGLCLVNHAVAKHHFTHRLEPQMGQVKHVSMLPLPGGAWHWRGIAETPSSYLVSRVPILGGAPTVPQDITKGDEHQVVQATRAYRLVQIFHDFARFPVGRYTPSDNGHIVRYSDLRFTGYGRETSWFDLVVRLDSGGQVQAIEFLNHMFAPSHPEF